MEDIVFIEMDRVTCRQRMRKRYCRKVWTEGNILFRCCINNPEPIPHLEKVRCCMCEDIDAQVDDIEEDEKLIAWENL